MKKATACSLGRAAREKTGGARAGTQRKKRISTRAMKRMAVAALCLLFALSVAGCAPQVGMQDVAAGGEPLSPDPQEQSGELGSAMQTSYEIRDGVAGFTLRYDDLPEEYRVSDGFSYEAMDRRPPLPVGDKTVLNAIPDPKANEVFYLWERGNAPSQTKYTADMSGYYDPSDFRPYVTALTVPEGVEVKGAVILLAGGAFQFRGDYTDTLPTAVQLREYGYRCFIVDYRLRPYTQEEGALDVARAVRFIRKNAEIYGVDPEHIAVMGYSAGGIQAGEFFISADGDVNGSYLDPDYIPDALDELPANASACGMIYSFYGRLSVASLDVEHLKAASLPPTFYCYGTQDPFYRQFEAQVALMDQVGIATNTIVLDEWPHGFGGNGGWVADFAAWLEGVFA